jgi:hypothetical protein
MAARITWLGKSDCRIRLVFNLFSAYSQKNYPPFSGDFFASLVANKRQPFNSYRSLFTRRTAIATAVFTIIFIGTLWISGRPWICKTGIGLWTGAWTPCTSQHLLDPYSLTHVLHGMIFYWLLRLCTPTIALHWRLLLAIVVEIGWELVENSQWVIERYRQETASLDYTGDSILNSVGDLLTMIVGFAFASRFSWKVAVTAFVVVEVGLLLTIRDNLTLNVLMLFVPSDAIKQWQLGG